jgi:hypothetical protein
MGKDFSHEEGDDEVVVVVVFLTVLPVVATGDGFLLVAYNRPCSRHRAVAAVADRTTGGLKAVTATV